MIYQKVNFDMFKKAFDVEGRGNQFSEDALKMLFDWMEGYYSDDLELDVIAFCLKFTEYTVEEFLADDDLADGIETVENLVNVFFSGEMDWVIMFDFNKDIILVNNDWVGG